MFEYFKYGFVCSLGIMTARVVVSAAIRVAEVVHDIHDDSKEQEKPQSEAKDTGSTNQ